MDPDVPKLLRRLVWATVVLYLVLAGFGIYVYTDASQRRAELEMVATDTSEALCTLRADLERRAEASQAFLDENPNGVPGIPAALIRDGLRDQLQTIDALANLSCEPS